MNEVKVEQWADSVIRDALNIINCGFDEKVAGHAVADAMEALAIEARILKAKAKEMEEKKQKYDISILAKTMSYTAKVVDEVLRLAKFMDGQPDSRPQSDAGVLSGLTDEQLGIYRGWIEENEREKRQSAATGA